MPKRLVYQFAINPRPLWQRCLKSVAAYAERIGADYHLETKMTLRVIPKNSQRSKEAVERFGGLPNCEKLAGTDRLGEYSQVAIIDADVWITPDAPDVFEPAWPNCGVAAVTERALPICDRYARKLDGYEKAMFGPLGGVGLPFLQCGVLVYNFSAKHFFPNGAKAFWEQPELEPFVDGVGPLRWSSEQVALSWWLRKNNASVAALDPRFNYLWGMLKPGRQREAWFHHFVLSDHIKGDDPAALANDDRERARI